jgi:hypothetical protein
MNPPVQPPTLDFRLFEMICKHAMRTGGISEAGITGEAMNEIRALLGWTQYPRPEGDTSRPTMPTDGDPLDAQSWRTLLAVAAISFHYDHTRDKSDGGHRIRFELPFDGAAVDGDDPGECRAVIHEAIDAAFEAAS